MPCFVLSPNMIHIKLEIDIFLLRGQIIHILAFHFPKISSCRCNVVCPRRSEERKKKVVSVIDKTTFLIKNDQIYQLFCVQLISQYVTGEKSSNQCVII